MGPNEIKEAPKPDYITKLKGGGKTYDVYVHSYLGTFVDPTAVRSSFATHPPTPNNTRPRLWPDGCARRRARD